LEWDYGGAASSRGTQKWHRGGGGTGNQVKIGTLGQSRNGDFYCQLKQKGAQITAIYKSQNLKIKLG
jgi:hypothetical protein